MFLPTLLVVVFCSSVSGSAKTASATATATITATTTTVAYIYALYVTSTACATTTITSATSTTTAINPTTIYILFLVLVSLRLRVSSHPRSRLSLVSDKNGARVNVCVFFFGCHRRGVAGDDRTSGHGPGRRDQFGRILLDHDEEDVHMIRYYIREGGGRYGERCGNLRTGLRMGLRIGIGKTFLKDKIDDRGSRAKDKCGEGWAMY